MSDDPFSEGVRQTLAVIEDHWPEIGGDISDSTWLTCICGWDSSEPRAIDWYQHLDNAVDEAIGVEARSRDERTPDQIADDLDAMAAGNFV